jgi:hypothetical protein
VTKALAVVDGATHLFEEQGTLDAACDEAIAWLDRTQRAGTPRTKNMDHCKQE